MDLLILILFVISLSCQGVLGQDESRSSSDKVSSDSSSVGGGGGAGNQARAIYSQRISPHRMMHFGKRYLYQEQPSFYASLPQGYDLYQQAQQPQVEMDIPSLFTLKMERGKTLRALLPDDADAKYLMYSYEHPQLRQPAQRQLQQQAFEVGLVQPSAGSSLASQRLSKLVSEALSENSNEAAANESAEKAQSSSNEEQQAIQGSTIRDTRSMQNMKNLPKKFMVANMLFGRSAPASLPAFGIYNKKAEPKDNFFMHFG